MLKQIRLLLNLTQSELAKLLGVERTTINKYETGVLNITAINEVRLLNIFFSKGITQRELNALADIIEVTAENNRKKGVINA